MVFKLLRPIINLLPLRASYALVDYLVGLPQPLPARSNDLMRQAQRISYGKTSNKVAWQWGDGPLVICVHGWGGAGAADMAPMAAKIASQGFQVIAIDMTAHGSSSGKYISFKQFISDITEFSHCIEKPVYAYIGFSAGGLSMMAARTLHGVSAQKYVCISSPRRPYPPLVLLKKKLSVSNKILDRYQTHLASQFDMDWNDITAQSFAEEDGKSLMLIYDTSDRFIDHSDGDEIKAIWSTAHLVKTHGNSHRQMPDSTEVINEVVKYLKYE
jgi:pimeloyl-ACP methyl ester carboxylesterase